MLPELRKKKLKGIILHCSDSSFGDAELIKHWHTDPKPKGNGWSDIGYNFVITNGILRKGDKYDISKDGIVQEGRDIKFQGAHAKGFNDEYLGICLIGKTLFSAKQFNYLFELIYTIVTNGALKNSCINTLNTTNLLGHYEVDAKGRKTCPNIDMNWLRAWFNVLLENRINT